MKNLEIYSENLQELNLQDYLMISGGDDVTAFVFYCIGFFVQKTSAGVSATRNGANTGFPVGIGM